MIIIQALLKVYISASTELGNDEVYYWLCATLILSLLPILVWNYKNDFISFTFHQARVTPQFSINHKEFLREVFGQIVYQNPFTFIICFISVINFAKRVGQGLATKVEWLFISVSLPVIFCFIGISLFRDTLPNWSGLGILDLFYCLGIIFLCLKIRIFTGMGGFS